MAFSTPKTSDLFLMHNLFFHNSLIHEWIEFKATIWENVAVTSLRSKGVPFHMCIAAIFFLNFSKMACQVVFVN